MKRYASFDTRVLREPDFGLPELRVLGFYGQVDRIKDDPDWIVFDLPTLSDELKLEPEVANAAHQRLIQRGYLEEEEFTDGDTLRMRHRVIGRRAS